MAQHLQVGLGHGVLGAGLRLLPWTATLLVVAPLAGSSPIGSDLGRCWRPGWRSRWWVWPGSASWPTPASPTPRSSCPSSSPGVGCSAAIPVSQAAVVGSVAHDEVGKAAGATNMLQELGGAFGVAVGVAVFAAAGSYASAQAVHRRLRAAIGAGAVLAALGLAAALALPRRRGRAQTEQTTTPATDGPTSSGGPFRQVGDGPSP